MAFTDPEAVFNAEIIAALKSAGIDTSRLESLHALIVNPAMMPVEEVEGIYNSVALDAEALPDPEQFIEGLALQGVTSESWVNGAKKTSVKEYFATATVEGGNATFYLTDDGTAGGVAVFEEVYLESVSLLTEDTTNSYVFGDIAVSQDKKSLTASVKKLGSVVAEIIQFVSAADGTVVRLHLRGI